MAFELQLQSQVRVNGKAQYRRRDFLRAISLAGAAAGVLPWQDAVALRADEMKKKGMHCILLWMQGGPSQFETWSPKPGHANGGETKAIATSVSGIQISENLPKTAQQMQDICLIRSMNSKEGSHPRATYLMRTGYLPTASVKYPTLGANVAHQLGDHHSELPNFVRINQQRGSDAGGLLGVDYDPFLLQSASRLPENTGLTTTRDRFQRRLSLLGTLEGGKDHVDIKQEVADHQKVYSKASKLVLSPQMERFDISKEPDSVRKQYGEGNFAAGCLLARRLVESGVSFVEVSAGNWDTHDDNFSRCKDLASEVDQPYAALLSDLKDRGLLENTLVVWMGEFGRTPKINPRGGRDHYPKNFSVALAGGGIRGGQVIGKTDASGESVTDRPVGVTDLLQTICHSLKMDAARENMSSIGRPIKVVDGGEVIKEAFA